MREKDSKPDYSVEVETEELDGKNVPKERHSEKMDDEKSVGNLSIDPNNRTVKFEPNSRGKEILKQSFFDAVMSGNVEKVLSEYAFNPECINYEDEDGMNALHLALVNFQSDMGIALLENTSISTLAKDKFGRDAMDLALICANNGKLGDKVWDRWSDEDEERHNKAMKDYQPKP